MIHTSFLASPQREAIIAQHAVLEALEKNYPVPRNHQRDLPYAVRDLSRLLTQERGALAKAYWSAPRLLSAYLRYFLPWNLFRLSWLLPGLPLRLPENSTILDLGSGPLTLPLALWCSRPDLRTVPLTFLCTDTAQAPLDAGKTLLSTVLGPDSPWRIKLFRDPMHVVLQKLKAPVQCIMAGNVLNELAPPKHTTLEQSVKTLAGKMEKALAPGGQLFLIEPGTRLGGKMISLARQGASEAGMTPLLPCPHNTTCPMLPKHQEGPIPPQQKYSGWCHFTYPATGAPADLIVLGKEAKITKHNLALSFVLLQKEAQSAALRPANIVKASGQKETLDDLEALFQEMMAEGDDMLQVQDSDVQESTPQKPAQPAAPPRLDEAVSVRVISAPIELPEESAPARYGCCSHGVALLLDSAAIFPGSLVTATTTLSDDGKQSRPLHDRKSGALILRLAKQGKKPVQAARPAQEKRFPPRAVKNKKP